jgi:hypothetical protein
VLAIAIATPGGIGSLTIRLLAQHRGVNTMAIRTRPLTDTELSLRLGPWISPQAELPYPCMSPHAATQPRLVIASGAASGIPQQPLPAVASELARSAQVQSGAKLGAIRHNHSCSYPN